ncbi:MAG: PEGA domain-containing protein [Deltaproteobacteria bacterium]|nr:PEGA domain-containing protein [Deltaproteobacteria bacterium]
MTQTPMTPPPEGTPIELDHPPVSVGTTVDDLARVPARVRARRLFFVLGGVALLGLTAAAAVFLLDAKPDTGTAQGESWFARLLASSGAASEDDATIDPAASLVTETYVPTGNTVPGMVYLDSLPDGAEVRIDGELIGKTPLMVGRAYEGEFASVQVSKKGYATWKGRVQIVDGGIRADITLKPLER